MNRLNVSNLLGAMAASLLVSAAAHAEPLEQGVLDTLNLFAGSGLGFQLGAGYGQASLKETSQGQPNTQTLKVDTQPINVHSRAGWRPFGVYVDYYTSIGKYVSTTHRDPTDASRGLDFDTTAVTLGFYADYVSTAWFIGGHGGASFVDVKSKDSSLSAKSGLSYGGEVGYNLFDFMSLSLGYDRIPYKLESNRGAFKTKNVADILQFKVTLYLDGGAQGMRF